MPANSSVGMNSLKVILASPAADSALNHWRQPNREPSTIRTKIGRIATTASINPDTPEPREQTASAHFEGAQAYPHVPRITTERAPGSAAPKPGRHPPRRPLPACKRSPWQDPCSIPGIILPETAPMLVIHQRIATQEHWDAELELTYEARSKSRLRCFSRGGEDVGLFLERGQPPLHDGECLQAEDGRIVRICARAEQLLHVTCANPFELMRAAYHLGNRHVALQLGDGWLRLPHDYVLQH